MTSKRELAVAIAKDVLKLLRLDKVQAERGVYVKSTQSGDLRQILRKATQPCEVCALGALFCARVWRVDQYTLKGGDASRLDCTNKLEVAFTPHQLMQIEYFFESGEYYRNTLMSSSSSWGRCKVYGSFWATADERLKAAMENIISHNGRFVLPSVAWLERERAKRGELVLTA